MPWWKIGLFLALGLVGLPLGADLLVDSSVVIARSFGVSETAIGLTLVAVGTSLPARGRTSVTSGAGSGGAIGRSARITTTRVHSRTSVCTRCATAAGLEGSPTSPSAMPV